DKDIDRVRALVSKLPELMADAAKWERAFRTVNFTAVEARPQGGRLTILPRAATATLPGGKGPQVVIEFKDTGEGMSEEQRQRAFTSLLSSTKTKGTGLGLAIVGRVVETHHGTITIDSQQGEGTTIR